MSLPGVATELLLRTTRASLRRPALFVLVASALTAASIWLASGLSVRSSFEELLPSDVPSVAEAKELGRRVGGDGTVLVVIESRGGPGGLSAAEALGTELTADFMGMGADAIRSVESTVLPVERYFADHWPLFASTADLQTALDTLDRRVEEEDPLGLRLEADSKPLGVTAADTSPSWADSKKPLPREEVAARFDRYRDGFLVHPDGCSLSLVVRPAGSALGVGEARKLLDRMRAVVDRRKSELDLGNLRVGFGGTFPLFLATYEAVLHDVASTATLVVTLVLLSLFIFFRDVRSTFSLGVAVLSAVALTFGVTRLVIGYLNTQTAFLGSIVLGNGINYGLIYLARVRQLRRAGLALDRACLEAAPRAAQATLLASAASSVSFGMLVLAANRGFRHFGVIGGVGMLLCWISTFTLVPALLQLFERWKPDKVAEAGRDPAALGVDGPSWLARAFSRPGIVVAFFVVLGAASVALFGRQLLSSGGAIEKNLDNLGNELKGQAELTRDNDRGNAALGKSVAGALALLPTSEAADAFCVVVRERLKEPRYAEVIQGCDTLSSVLPTDQDTKLGIIGQLADRLTPRIIGSFPPDQQSRLRGVRADLEAQRKIGVGDVPATLLDRFKERDGTVGRLAAITAQPNAHLEEGPSLATFVEGVRDVRVDGRSFNATGEKVIFADLLKNIELEGPLATAGSFAGVAVLVVLFLRQIRTSATVLTVLVLGVLLMAGAAALLDVKINFFNFIVFPITFGIAVDYGANVAVRVRAHGGNVLAALVEVGPAVALCSWTSMIGYGTLLVAQNRALRSFGWYAVIGEITSIATALCLLPAIALLRRGSRDRGGAIT